MHAWHCLPCCHSVAPHSYKQCRCRAELAQLQALCAGHVAAVQTAAAAASESLAHDSSTDNMERALAIALPLAASALPGAVEPFLLDPWELLIKQEPQVRVGQSVRSAAARECRSWASSWSVAQPSTLLASSETRTALLVSRIWVAVPRLCRSMARHLNRNSLQPRTALALQGIGDNLERAKDLCFLFDCQSETLAVALAGSSLPRTALELAAELDRASIFEAKAEVRTNCTAAWHDAISGCLQASTNAWQARDPTCAAGCGAEGEPGHPPDNTCASCVRSSCTGARQRRTLNPGCAAEGGSTAAAGLAARVVE